MNFDYKVIGLEYKGEVFYKTVKGYENLGEGSERCFKCFKLRLEETAKFAKDKEFDYFTTTLTISPMKNATKINEIGVELGNKYDIKFLNSDFKKNNGYKQSVDLSKEFNLYRQDYCGCVFSKQEAIKRMQDKENI